MRQFAKRRAVALATAIAAALAAAAILQAAGAPTTTTRAAGAAGSGAAAVAPAAAAAAASGSAAAAPSPLPVAGNSPAAPVPFSPATTPVLRYKETILYAMPPDAAVLDTLAAPDGRSVGCIEMRSKKYAVNINGVRGREAEWIVGGKLAFSPDGSRFTYQTQHDGLMFVALGPTASPAAAVEGKGYFLVGRVTLSPDGKRYAYWAKPQQGGQAIMVVDGRELPGEYDEINDSETVFSPDGKRLAFRASLGTRQVFVIDGVGGKPYDAALGATFSSDGGRVAYRAKVGEECFVVLDGREGPRYEMVAGLTFSAGGRRFAYCAGRKGKQMLVVDTGPKGQPAAKEYLPYDGLGDVTFSPDGRRLGITAQTGNKWRAIVDGREGTVYEGVSRLLFSADSRRVAYVAGSKDRQCLVVDGVEGPQLDSVTIFNFGPEGSRVAYRAVRNGERVLMVDHKPFAPAGLFAFSPNGHHVAHEVPRAAEKLAIAVDNVLATPDFDGFLIGTRMKWETTQTVSVIVGRNAQEGRPGQLIKMEITVGTGGN